jgi:hypothetical protein
VRWRLNAAGVPSAAPVATGAESAERLIGGLSLFALRPVGLTLPSTCPSDSSKLEWRDALDRLRSFSFRVLEVKNEQVLLAVTGSVTTRFNRWQIEGQVSIALDDGFTGEARLHVMGPGFPNVNDTNRVTRVSIDP